MHQNNEKGLDLFDYLGRCGYTTALFYDNYGRFIISVELHNKDTLQQLDQYIEQGRGAFPYYDIIAFHHTDNDLATEFILQESSRG
jgi:hypothetical protein